MDEAKTAAAEIPLFVLAEPAPFWWTVRIPHPGDGEYQFAALELQFQPVDQAELDGMQGLGLADGASPPTDEQICRRIVLGWRKFNRPDGSAVPFTPETLEQLLRVPMARPSIVATYLTVMRGLARKNG